MMVIVMKKWTCLIKLTELTTYVLGSYSQLHSKFYMEFYIKLQELLLLEQTFTDKVTECTHSCFVSKSSLKVFTHRIMSKKFKKYPPSKKQLPQKAPPPRA